MGIKMGKPGVEHVQEAIGRRCPFQTTKLAGIDLILDIIDEPRHHKVLQYFRKTRS